MTQVAFENIIAPISKEVFKSDFRGIKPLVVQRSQSDTFCQVLDVDCVDRIISTHSLAPSELALIKAGEKIPYSEFVDARDKIEPAKVIRHHAEGATIALHGMEAHHTPLANLCASLEFELGAICGANVYVTPPRSQGFRPHFDIEDVFILQAYGSKRWRLYSEAVRYPIRSHIEGPQLEDAGNHTHDVVLEAGDTMYIPRGVVHEAACLESTSIHVTLGALPFTWGELLFESLWHSIVHDYRFREAVPAEIVTQPGNHPSIQAKLKELTSQFLESLNGEMAASSMRARFDLRRRGLSSNGLAQVEMSKCLHDHSTLSRRPFVRFEIAAEGGELTVVCSNGNTLSLPIVAIGIIEAITERERFTVSELPGPTTLRMQILQQMVYNGALAVDG